MDWFSILKNQVASTKGKQFQLDFTQPMVEEDDDCKRDFFAVVDKLKNLEIYGLVKKPAEYPKSKGFIFERDSKRVLEIFFSFDGIEKVPNEVFCYDIDQYKNTQIRNFKMGKINDYQIQTIKGEKFPQDEDEIHYVYYMSFVLAGRREIYMTVNIMSYADNRLLGDKLEELIRSVISF